MRLCSARILAFLILVLVACRSEETPPPGVIGKVGARQLTLDEFRRYVERNAGTPLNQIAPPAASALLDQYLDEVVLSEIAAARGLTVSPAQVTQALRNEPGVSVVEKTDEMRRARLVNDIYARMPRPSDRDIATYYSDHPEEFRNGDQVRARQILIHDEAKAQQALAEIKKGIPFEEVSKKYSSAPNASRGGDIGFVGRGQLPKVFEDVIFSLKEGESSSVIKTDANFLHIFKVDKIQKAGVVPLEAAAPIVEQKLREEQLRNELDKALAAGRRDLNPTVHVSQVGFSYRGKYGSTGE